MEGTGLLLHIHAAVGKYITKFILEDIQYRDTLFLLRITFAEQVSNPECAEK